MKTKQATTETIPAPKGATRRGETQGANAMAAHSEAWIQGYQDAYNLRPADSQGYDAADYAAGYAAGHAAIFG